MIYMNKKGFTLIELLGVIILLGIITTIAITGYSRYLASSKRKAFTIEENNIINATRSAYADCISNHNNNDFCSNHPDLDIKFNYQVVYLKELIDNNYIDLIKNPYNVEQSCDTEKSYVYVSNRNNKDDSVNSEIIYKACLICGDHKSTDCLDEDLDYSSYDTTCNSYYNSIGNEKYDGKWTDQDVVLDFGASGNYRYGINEFIYSINGSETSRLTAKDNMGSLVINNSVGNKEYKVQAYDGMNNKGTLVSCGNIKIDKGTINSVNITASANNTKIDSNSWVNVSPTLTVDVNPTTSVSGYLYQWYLNGEEFGKQTSANTLIAQKNGNYQVEVTNQVGKIIKKSNEFAVKIDTLTPPVIQGGTGIWTITTPTISVKTAGTATSGVKHYEYYKSTSATAPTVSTKATGTTTGNLTISDIGTTYVYYRTVSNTGYVSDWSNAQVVKIDKITTPVIQGGSNNWHTSEVTISIKTAGTATSGVKHYEYYKSTSNIAPTASTKATGTTTGNLKITDNGTTYVYYRTVSKAGYVSDWTNAQVVKIETITTPVIQGGSDNWHTSGVTISIKTAGTATSGVKHYEYYKSTSATAPTTSTKATGTTSGNLTVNDVGTTYTYYRTVSNGGNVSSWTSAQVVKIDSVSPPVLQGGSDNWHTSGVTISVKTAGTATSGVKEYEYYKSTSATAPTTSTTATGTTSGNLTVNDIGTTYVYYRTVSNAGYSGDWTSAQVVKIETLTAPVIQGGSSSWLISAPTISVKTVGTATSGIKHYEYYKALTTTAPTTSTTATGTTSGNLTITDNGTTYVYYRTVSNGGNVSNWSNSQMVKLDTINPTVSVSVSGKVAVFTFSDNIGVAAYGVNQSSTTAPGWTSISTTVTTWTASSAGTYYVWVKDVAGKIGKAVFTISQSAFCAYPTNTIWTYSYTGGAQSFTVPCSGTYKLEVWGAQGGSHNSTDHTEVGGNGGYSHGNKSLSLGTSLYIYVGGQGAERSTGGYNGGGSCNHASECAGGGGATHIATSNRGILANYSSYRSEVLIVAGGGGGGGGSLAKYGAKGGTGGGTSGGDATATDVWTGALGKGGTQTAGGAGTGTDTYTTGEETGSFGTGGKGTQYAGSGGGAGWYGGGAGGNYNGGSPGGGGSGYIGGVTGGSMTNGSRSGNGYARITLVSISN